MLLLLARMSDVGSDELIDDCDWDDHGRLPLIIMAEDKPVILIGSLHIPEDTLPNIRIPGFQTGAEALDFAQSNRIDTAFPDIELCGESEMVIAAGGKLRLFCIFINSVIKYNSRSEIFIFFLLFLGRIDI